MNYDAEIEIPQELVQELHEACNATLCKKIELTDSSKPDKAVCYIPQTQSLKISSSLDFRKWEAAAVACAWKQHGSIEKCIENVKNDTNDPKSYCGLLRVAANEATQILKTNSVKAEEKTFREQSISSYAMALFEGIELKDLPGLACKHCFSDNVDIHGLKWHCLSCGEAGKIRIKIK